MSPARQLTRADEGSTVDATGTATAVGGVTWHFAGGSSNPRLNLTGDGLEARSGSIARTSAGTSSKIETSSAMPTRKDGRTGAPAAGIRVSAFTLLPTPVGRKSARGR
jgi:hypothetical protein